MEGQPKRRRGRPRKPGRRRWVRGEVSEILAECFEEDVEARGVTRTDRLEQILAEHYAARLAERRAQLREGAMQQAS